MTLTLDQITSEALQLPGSSRAELADQLVASLDVAMDETIQSAWTAEALRRRDEVRSDLVQTIPGEQVFAEVQTMLAR